jgi:hypothetical protein
MRENLPKHAALLKDEEPIAAMIDIDGIAS